MGTQREMAAVSAVGVEIRVSKSLEYCYCPPMKLREGNVLQASVILSTGGHVCPPCIVSKWAVCILLECYLY